MSCRTKWPEITAASGEGSEGVLIDDDADGFTHVVTVAAATVSIAIPAAVQALAKRYDGRIQLLANSAGDFNLLPNGNSADCSTNQFSAHASGISTGNGLRLAQGAFMNFVAVDWSLDANLGAGARSFFSECRSSQTLPAVNFSAVFQGLCSQAAALSSFFFNINSGSLPFLPGTTFKIWAVNE